MTKGNKELYETIMMNLRTVGNKQYAVVPVELLFVDEEYQRIESRSEEKIKRLVANWDWNQMDALKVVPHPEIYMCSTVDGLGRLSAARILGYTHLECEVLNGPKDPENRRKFEASIFVKQTEAVEPLKPGQMHKARLLLGDSVAIALDELLKKYNVEYTNTKGRREEHYLGSYTRAYNTVKIYGKEFLEFIFVTIEKAGYSIEPDGYCSYVLDALKKIHVAYPTVTEKILASFIRKMKPATLKAKALSKYSDRTNAAAVTLFLQDHIVETLGEKARYDAKGKLIA